MASISRRIVPALAVALLAFVAALAVAALPATVARASGTGAFTIAATSANQDTSYRAYQVFSADVSENAGKRTASNLAWGSEAVETAADPALRELGASDSDLVTAQSAADWISDQASADDVASALASAVSSLTSDATLAPGTAATLSSGYWLVASDTSSPALVLVGGSAQTVSPKGGVPTLEKAILEDGTRAWQKAADATVGDDLWRRDQVTVPAGISGYSSERPYRLVLRDTLSSGIDTDEVLSSLSVRVRPGTDGSWCDASGGGENAADPVCEAKDGWSDLSGCAASLDGRTIVVTFPDLGAKLEKLGGSLEGGAQICVTYNAPLDLQVETGSVAGTQTSAELEYPTSPRYAASQASGPVSAKARAQVAETALAQGRAVTPRVVTYAYTWRVVLTKRPSNADGALAGAKLRIRDDRGRYLAADGTWGSDASASVTTGADGKVSFTGADSGTFTVEELAAPDGYEKFDGEKKVEVAVSGLDQFTSAANAKLALTAQAESPLEVDAVDTENGKVEMTVRDAKAGGNGGGGAGGSGNGGGSASHGPAKTGDVLPYVGAAALAAILAAAVAMAARKRRREDGGAR